MAYHHAIACISSPKVHIISRRLHRFRNDDIQGYALTIYRNKLRMIYTAKAVIFQAQVQTSPCAPDAAKPHIILKIKALWSLTTSFHRAFCFTKFNERSLLCAFRVRGCADYGKGCALSTIEVCKQQEHTEPSLVLVPCATRNRNPKPRTTFVRHQNKTGSIMPPVLLS